MIDLGEPMHAADTGFVRAPAGDVFALLADPYGHPAFWPQLRTLDHKVSHDDEGAIATAVGDRWRLRALFGVGGLDVECEVTDMRRQGERRHVWMDWRGHRDPVVGLGLNPRVFEAETEWWVRPWPEAVPSPDSRGDQVSAARGTLVTFFWRVRSTPRRPQQRLLAQLRRLGWRGLHGLKAELEGRR